MNLVARASTDLFLTLCDVHLEHERVSQAACLQRRHEWLALPQEQVTAGGAISCCGRLTLISERATHIQCVMVMVMVMVVVMVIEAQVSQIPSGVRSEGTSGASRLVEAMVWISEIESAKSITEPKTSKCTMEAELQSNFEVLDSKIASGLKNIINGDCFEIIFIDKSAQKEKRFPTGRQAAWISDADESDLDLDEILKVQLKNDNVQLFNTRWDETVIAMKKQPDCEMLENVHYHQLFQSEQLKQLLSL